jgi:hypothetical protein
MVSCLRQGYGTARVFCEARSFCSVPINVLQKVRNVAVSAMAEAVSRRHLTAESRVQPKLSPFGFSGEKSGSATVFCPVSAFPPTLHTVFIHHWR